MRTKRGVRLHRGSVRSTQEMRVGPTRNWPANIGWVRRSWSNRRCGLAVRVGNCTWWFAVMPR